MNATDAPETLTAETAEERVARQMGMMAELAEIGMEMARALRDRVVAGAPAGPGEGDPMLAYSRLARAIRLTLALEARLAEGPLFPPLADPVARVEASQDEMRARRDLVRDAVEDAIEAESRERGGRAERERLMERLCDWMDEGEDALFVGPLERLAERICRDLGIKWDPRYWTDATAWAEDHEMARRAAGGRVWPGRALNSCDSS